MDEFKKLGAIVGGMWGAISGLFFISAIYTSAFAELDSPIITIEEKIILFPAYVVSIITDYLLIPLFNFLLSLNLIHPKYLVIIVIFILPLILSMVIGSLICISFTKLIKKIERGHYNDLEKTVNCNDVR